MSPQNSELLQMLRDLRTEMSTNHKELSAELKEVRRSLDSRLDEVEKKVDTHQHYFQTGHSILKYALPSSGVLALLWAWVTGSTGQGK